MANGCGSRVQQDPAAATPVRPKEGISTMSIIKVRRALLSVSDKSGLVNLARGLAEVGAELISTGGTRKALASAGLPVRDISEITGFPEILDGRVKTLHPAVHSGILAKRDKSEHLQTLAEHQLPVFDLIVVNLYAFASTVSQPNCTIAQASESIDIGGPTMIRAAAKNYAGVAVLTDPLQYPAFVEELKRHQGKVDLPLRQRLAQEAFVKIAAYDQAIARWFSEQS